MGVIEAFQALFDRTFKPIYTRDRKGQRVPKRLVVESVKRVINMKIWEEYTLRREMALYEDGAKDGAKRGSAFPAAAGKAVLSPADLYKRVSNLKARFPHHSEEAIREALEASGWHAGQAAKALDEHDRQTEVGVFKFPGKAPLTGGWVSSEAAAAGLDFALREDVNEAMLFHGTSSAAAEAITREDFRLKLSGSNAGTLFGRGIYLAECVSKSDEYTEEVAGVRTILVCRATLGRVLYTDAPSPNVDDLEQRCGYEQAPGEGQYDSVLGDREKCSGTYREFIVYDDDFVYPDFIVKYRRRYY